MKKKWKHLITGFTMFVLCISVCTTTANATIVWQDNFDDLDDWTLYGYENTSSQVMIDGDFSTASGMLEVLDDDVNIARHDSTTDVGSWIFDMYVPDGYWGAFYVEFLSNGTVSWAGATNYSHVSAGFFLDAFIVWKERAPYQGSILATAIMDSIQGWHHIEVNRTSGGHFEVCINGTLRAFFDYTRITSSTYLQVYSNNATGAALDNLIVSDDLNYPTTPTTPTTTPTTTNGGDGLIDGPIIIGVVVAVAVIALVIIFLRRR